MITKQQRTRLQRAINRLVRANEDYAFRGAGHPEDIDGIEQELRDAKRSLKQVLDDLMVADTEEGRRRQIEGAT